MGALGDGEFCGELENGVRLEFLEVAEEEEGGGGYDLGSESTVDIEDAVKVLLQSLGEDHNRGGLKKTPLRVAKALREGTRGYRQKVNDIVQGALFPEAGLDSRMGQAGGAGGLVVVRDINLFSYCESCLLPFRVECHVGYVPSGQRVVGLSKLARVADVFAKRLQNPQRLADDVCSALQNSIKPAGVAVVLQCWHIQFPEALRTTPNLRHPSKPDIQGWLQAPVYSNSGVLGGERSDFWVDFLALLKFKGVNLEKLQTRFSPIQNWCPARSPELPQCNGHGTQCPTNGKISSISSKSGATQAAMIAAVTSIISSLGEDPGRKELKDTPYRFVQWLMNFKRSDLENKPNGFTSDLHKIANGDVPRHHGEMHSELNLLFCSQCEHHLLPFHGVVHIGYFDAEEAKHIDRSILQSVVHFYGCKLQVQERLTRQIAETVSSVFNTGVMVVVEANHICMVSRGIEKLGSSTATIAVMGQFAIDPAAKAMFLQTISNGTASGG